MECDRCHFENYDEAYSCRRCGAKLRKNKKSDVDDFTSPRNNYSYDNYNQQRDYSYQNNNQQRDYSNQNSYNQQYGNYGYQNNYAQQQNNYNQQHNFNFNNQNSNFASSRNNQPDMDMLKDIPADGKIHRIVDNKTEYLGNKVVHKKPLHSLLKKGYLQILLTTFLWIMKVLYTKCTRIFKETLTISNNITQPIAPITLLTALIIIQISTIITISLIK